MSSTQRPHTSTEHKQPQSGEVKVAISPDAPLDVIRKATLQPKDIVAAFNKGLAESDSPVTQSSVRGELLLPGEFMLVHKNNVPRLIPPMKDGYSVAFPPFKGTAVWEKLETFTKQIYFTENLDLMCLTYQWEK